VSSLVYAWWKNSFWVWVLNRDEDPPQDCDVMVQHSLPREEDAHDPDLQALMRRYPCTIRMK